MSIQQTQTATNIDFCSNMVTIYTKSSEKDSKESEIFPAKKSTRKMNVRARHSEVTASSKVPQHTRASSNISKAFLE